MTFGEVDDIELDFLFLFNVKNFEKVPAGVTLCVAVNPHQ
jgi:hypothetical protein